MDSNINDPIAVKALLNQLRASRAWQDALNPPPADDSTAIAPPSSVASLLSQLKSSAASGSAPPAPSAHNTHQSTPAHLPECRTPRPVATTGSSVRVQDIRSISFQEALPHLTRLAGDPAFLTAISRLRDEQNELERQLWEERQVIHKKHEEKVKVARTKATLIGAGLSKHEAEMMNDAYRRDLQRFDRERALLAWDALIQKQQAALETLGVPAMFTTVSQAECQKQRRVVQVLEGL